MSNSEQTRAIKFPPRDLGGRAEAWGREIERAVKSLASDNTVRYGSFQNTQRAMSGQISAVAEQMEVTGLQLDHAFGEIQYAQASADGKSSIYYSHEPPEPDENTVLQPGDTWFDTNNGNKIHEWDGEQWVDVMLGVDAIADDAISAEKLQESIRQELENAQQSLTSAITEWVASSSPTVPPTSGWSTTPPTWTPGQYIWERVTTTRANGATETSDPVVITGNPGEPGEPGAPGESTYTWIKYSNSASGNNPVDDPAGMAYIGIAYNKSTPTESTDPSDYEWALLKGADGQDGTDGTDGRGIASTEIHYQVGSSGTSAPTGTWVSNPPAVPQGQYLWTRVVTSYTTGSPTTAYSVARQGEKGNPGTPGSPGSPGTDGKSVTSVTPYFRLGTSTPAKPTTMTPSGWSTTEPAYVPGSANNLYVTVRTVLSDNSFTYSDVSLDSAYAAGKAAHALAQTAQSTANGKNKVVRSSGNAASPGSYQAGDSWWKYSGSQIVAMWLHDGTNWVSQTLTDSVITNLNAGTITAGTIAADRIGANSITTEKLMVGDFTNLFNSTYFRTGSGAVELGGASAYTGSEVAPTGGHLVSIGSRDHYASSGQYVTAKPGEEFYVEVVAKRIAGTAELNPKVAAWTQSGGTPSGMSGTWGTASLANGSVDLGNGWVRRWAYIKIPDTAVNVAFTGLYLQISQTAPYTTTWLVTNPVVRRRSAGELIVDGAITTDKLYANAVTTAKINAGAVTANEIASNAVTAIKISSQAVTADKMSANSITAANGAIANLAVTEAKIADLAVTNAKIANGTIQNAKIANLDAAKITTGTLNADRIGANAITAGKIAGGAIDGMVITGATVRTAASGSRVQLDTLGLRTFNASGTETSRLTAETGGLSIGTSNGTSKLGLTAHSNYAITSTESTSTSSNSASAFSIADRRASGSQRYYAAHVAQTGLGSGSQGQAILSLTEFTNNTVQADLRTAGAASLFVTSSNSVGVYADAGVAVRANNSSSATLSSRGGSASMAVLNTAGTSSPGQVSIASNGRVTLIGESQGDFIVGRDSTGARVWSMAVYNRTYGSASNMHITSAGTLGRSTSARRYKLDEQVVDVQDYEDSLLSIDFKSWIDKRQSEEIEKLAAYREENPYAPVPPQFADLESFDEPVRHIGAVSEDFVDAGLPEFVTYNDKGEPDGLQYDRVGVALIPIVKKLRDRIEELESVVKLNEEK